MPGRKTKLVRIGSSRGVRLPKRLIQQAGLEEDVEVQVRGNTIVISATRRPRAGWVDAARRLHAAAEDRLDAWKRSDFDESEWEW